MQGAVHQKEGGDLAGKVQHLAESYYEALGPGPIFALHGE